MRITKLTLTTIATWYFINIILFYAFYYAHTIEGVTEFPPHNYLFEVIGRIVLFGIAGFAISTKVNGKMNLTFLETIRIYRTKYGLVTFLSMFLWLCYYTNGTLSWKLMDFIGSIGQDVVWNFTDLGWHSLYICTQILPPSALSAYLIFFLTYFFVKSSTCLKE